MTSSNATQPGMTPLVIRFGRLGDMVLQAPLLHLLHQRYGKPCTLFSRGSWPAQIYAGHPDVGEVRQLLGRHTPVWMSPERWRMIAALRQHAGPIYVSEDTKKSLRRIRELLRLARVPANRCVFVNDCFRSSDEHWVDQLLRFGRTTPAAYAAAVGDVDAGNLQTAPQLCLNDDDRRDLSVWMKHRQLADSPLVLLQPGNWKSKKWWRDAAVDPKAWPIDHWVALMRAIHSDLPTANLLLCGSPIESAFLETIRQAAQLPCAQVAANDLPIRRLLALMQRAHSMVSVDTGPAHFAAAMGCPLVVLYGSYSPARWDRRSPVGAPIINLGGPPRLSHVADIPVEPVVDAWRTLRPSNPHSKLATAAGF